VFVAVGWRVLVGRGVLVGGGLGRWVRVAVSVGVGVLLGVAVEVGVGVGFCAAKGRYRTNSPDCSAMARRSSSRKVVAANASLLTVLISNPLLFNPVPDGAQRPNLIKTGRYTL